jgi:hypothetical protein
MPSHPQAASHRPGSVRSSFLARIPRGFGLFKLQSDTNSTMTGISGPGRIVGSLLSSAGRRFERIVDRFAEERLGLGPNMAALRLASALHDLHVSEKGCHSDHIAELKASEHVTDRLIWACNGYCSQCHASYLPSVLIEIPEYLLKVILQLIKYLEYVFYIVLVLYNDNPRLCRVTQLMSNIGFSCVYIRLLVQSNVLSMSVCEQLRLLDTMRETRNFFWPPHLSHDSTTDELVALDSAIAAIHQMREDRVIAKLIRFPLPEIAKWEERLEMLNEYSRCIR